MTSQEVLDVVVPVSREQCILWLVDFLARICPKVGLAARARQVKVEPCHRFGNALPPAGTD